MSANPQPRPSATTLPETIEQARTWERVKNHALAFGICHACAAQLAWGHQLGFAETTRPPCDSCLAVVAQLPLQKLNGWRSVSGRAVRASAWRINPSGEDPSEYPRPDSADVRGPQPSPRAGA
ncbi:hypothetical protein Cpa01nite_33140 [Cellulomonas pakistanensis]|uniref:Uncharacterized protein n=1 Tax=Cellulomonas pakistanensis TaxID=992287 RepID=A0A919PD18_9CELL|nr:hypothetical protein Cpa01nite_33140 [Cellulomonas pakistanensis]